MAPHLPTRLAGERCPQEPRVRVPVELLQRDHFSILSTMQYFCDSNLSFSADRNPYASWWSFSCFALPLSRKLNRLRFELDSSF